MLFLKCFNSFEPLHDKGTPYQFEFIFTGSPSYINLQHVYYFEPVEVYENLYRVYLDNYRGKREFFTDQVNVVLNHFCLDL